MKKLMMMRCTRVVDAKEPASLLVVAILRWSLERRILRSAGSLSNRISVAISSTVGAVALEMKVRHRFSGAS